MVDKKEDTQVIRLEDGKKFTLAKIVHIFENINFSLLLLFLATLVTGVIMVFAYNGDNDDLYFRINVTLGNLSVSDNGIIAIFCFIFVLLYLLVALTETVLIFVQKKGNLTKKQCVFAIFYVLIVILAFSLVTAGLFVKLNSNLDTTKPYDIGFYHYWVSGNTLKQTLSALGYVAVGFSLLALAIYFPYKKYCLADKWYTSKE